MNKKIFSIISGLLLSVLIIYALFTNDMAQTVAKEVVHEVKTYDVWKQSAFTPMNSQSNIIPAALTKAASPKLIPIKQGEAPPHLIKELGIEAVQINGGKLKIITLFN